MEILLLADRGMTIKVSTLKNGEVRQRVMTIRPNTLSVSWYEGVCHKVSVEWEPMKYTMPGLHKDFSGGWMMTTVKKMIVTVQQFIRHG